MLTAQQVKRFQEIYNRNFGVSISSKEAYEEGIRLVNLIKTIYRPISELEYKRLKERRGELNNRKFKLQENEPGNSQLC